MLLSAPKYFNLKETEKGTVLVNRGVLVKEDMSEKYDNVRQFYFQDLDDNNALKCLNGGQLSYIVDLHNIDKSKEVKIVYNGTTEIQNGKYAGQNAHQFGVELLNADAVATQEPVVETTNADELE